MCRMQDCVCVSKLVVKQLWKYCPEVATYFAEDACLYNMTAAMLEEASTLFALAQVLLQKVTLPCPLWNPVHPPSLGPSPLSSHLSLLNSGCALLVHHHKHRCSTWLLLPTLTHDGLPRCHSQATSESLTPNTMLDVFKYRLFLLMVLLGNGCVFGQRKTLTTT